ncbi:MAG: hypothetical protein WBD07_00090, partial [Vicinamibacterales bacterium]
GVADQTDLKNEEHGTNVLIGELTKTLRRDGFAHLTEDSHINDRVSAAAAFTSSTLLRFATGRRRLQTPVSRLSPQQFVVFCVRSDPEPEAILA